MQIEFVDFNGSEDLFRGHFSKEWSEIEDVLKRLPLHLKASDQAGKIGNPIFDPVGTNAHVKSELQKMGWAVNIPIPREVSFLGTDVDFGKGGVLGEVQFSNYPFLLNNLLRAEYFFKAKIPLRGEITGASVIVTKAHMFPASNSTLYYEQGKRQLAALAENSVFDVPLRFVGLFERQDKDVRIVWTRYKETRYSREVVKREVKTAQLIGGSTRSRSRITL